MRWKMRTNNLSCSLQYKSSKDLPKPLSFYDKSFILLNFYTCFASSRLKKKNFAHRYMCFLPQKKKKNIFYLCARNEQNFSRHQIDSLAQLKNFSVPFFLFHAREFYLGGIFIELSLILIFVIEIEKIVYDFLSSVLEKKETRKVDEIIS